MLQPLGHIIASYADVLSARHTIFGHPLCDKLKERLRRRVATSPLTCFIFCFSERTGLADSPCDDDSQCNSGLFCSVHVFEGGKCQELRKDGESCTKGILSRDPPKCAEGLNCMRTG